MNQPDLFQKDTKMLAGYDATILALWLAGADLDKIATACGTTTLRAAFDVNRVLNKQTEGMDFARYRELLP
jgi:hypothetical protein